MKTRWLIVCLAFFIVVACENQSNISEKGKQIISKTTYSVMSKTTSNRNAVGFMNQMKKQFNKVTDYPATEIVDEYDVTVYEYPDTTYKAEVDFSNNTASEFESEVDLENPNMNAHRTKDSVEEALTLDKIIYEEDMVTSYNSNGDMILQEDISAYIPDSLKKGLKEINNPFMNLGKLNDQTINDFMQNKDIKIISLGNQIFQVEQNIMMGKMIFLFDGKDKTIIENKHFINDELINETKFEYTSVMTKYGMTTVLQKRISDTKMIYPNGLSFYLKNETIYKNFKKEYFQ